MLKQRIKLSLIVVCLLGLCVWGFWQVNYAYARQLVTASDVLNSFSNQLQAGEVLHYIQTSSHRIDPNLTELPDPYHRPLVPFLSANQLTEIRITADGTHSVTRLDEVAKTVVEEFIDRPDATLFYYPLVGTIIETPKDGVTVDAAAQAAATADINSVSWISGIQESSWNRLAWLVEFQPEALTNADFPSFAGNPGANSPMADDLQFDETKWVWEIDQQTGRLVSRQWWALTQGEPTRLYSETYSLPELVTAAAAPQKMDEFWVADAASLRTDIESVLQGQVNHEEVLMFGAATTPEQVAQAVNFSIYTPDPAVLNHFTPRYDSTRIYYSPGNKCHFRRPLAFDFDLCAGLENTVKFEYSFAEQPSYEDMRAVYVSQAPAAETVPLLQQSPPRWPSSQSLQLQLQGQQVTAWSTPVTDENMTTNALMFELDGTFVRVDGYKMTTDELVAVAESLEQVDVASVNHQLFMPIIRN